jgi:hypothetical protein
VTSEPAVLRLTVRQLLEVPQRQLLEKCWRRAVQERTAHAVTATDNLDQTALMERLKYRSRAYASNLFDFSTPDRLAISNDRERLESGSGQPGRTRRQLGALDSFGVLRASKNLPAAARVDELNPMSFAVIVEAQLVERGENSRTPATGIKRD